MDYLEGERMSQSVTPIQRRKAWWTAGVAGMASYMDAGAIVTTGTALVLYRDELGLTEGNIAQLSGMLTAMIAVGALIGGPLADRFGRRRVFTLTLMVYIVATGILVFVPSVELLYVGIFLLGFSSGADLPPSLAMIAESAPEGEEGKFVTLSHALWMAVIPIVNIFGVIVGGMAGDGARIMYAHLLVVAVIVLILRWRLPESDMWKNKRAAVESGSIDKASLKVLFGRTYIWALIGISLFYAIQNIAANTNGQYSVYIYEEVVGVDVSTASMLNVISVLIGIIGTFIVMKLLDTRWRMTLFVLGTLIGLIAWLVPAALGVSVVTIFVMATLYWFAQQPSGEPMFKIWSQEIFPTEYRGAAQGIAIAFTRAVAAGAALMTPALLAYSFTVFFLIITGVVLVAGLIGYFWVSRMPQVIHQEKTGGPQDAVELAEAASPVPRGDKTDPTA